MWFSKRTFLHIWHDRHTYTFWFWWKSWNFVQIRKYDFGWAFRVELYHILANCGATLWSLIVGSVCGFMENGMLRTPYLLILLHHCENALWDLYADSSKMTCSGPHSCQLYCTIVITYGKIYMRILQKCVNSWVFWHISDATIVPFY